jgi:hypothetical protein
VLGHVVAYAGFGVLELLLPRFGFEFWVSWRGTALGAFLSALTFGTAQALAWGRSDVAAPVWRWAVLSGLAAGVAYGAGMQGMSATIKLGLPASKTSPALDATLPYLIWGALTGSQALVTAAGQGFLVYRSSGRNAAILWTAAVFGAWLLSQLALSVPGWIVGPSVAPRMPAGVAVLGSALWALLYAAYTFPALRFLVQAPSGKVTGRMPKEAWPPAWRNAK